MKSILIFIFLFTVIIVGAPIARSQTAPGDPAVLGNTTLGRSQNDERDLANSLVATPQKFGKGEKKSQVNASELKSKSIKDATFGGSLLNEGIDTSAPKLDAAKVRAAPSEEKPAATKTTSSEQTTSASQQSAPNQQVPAGLNQPRISESGFTFSNLSQTATLGEELGQSDAAAAPASTSKSAANPSANAEASKKDQGGQEKSPEKPADR